MDATDRTLRRIVINKEVVLLRQAVRKARVCAISKLTREAKKLRNKRGDEKQLEKNKRKAEKLGREVTALKTVKDDEIARYGILNLEQLQQVSQDPKTLDSLRVTAKVANQKSLLPKLQEFREKFPDYGEYINMKKKKAKAKEKKPEKEVDTKDRRKEPKRVPTVQPVDENNDSNNSNDNLNESENDEQLGNDSGEHSDSSNDATDNENKVASPPTRIQSKAMKSKVSKEDIVTKIVPNQEPKAYEEPQKPVKVISKVATVKRFAEVLQEENESSTASDSEEIHAKDENIELEKEVDDFFMSADNNGAHFVVAPIATVENTETEWDERNRDRYFNKSSQRRPEKSFSNNNKWDSGPKRKGKWNDTDRPPLNKPHRAFQHQEYRKGNVEPEKKKSRRNDESASVKESEHLHPSWEAKRKQQEILKQGFQGKKIVFGED